LVSGSVNAELKEGFGYFNVGKRVYLVQGAETHVQQVMLPGDMSKTIDDPGSLVIAPILRGVDVSRGCIAVLVVSRDERDVSLVDRVEDVLAPCHQVTPDTDIVMNIRQSLSPRLEDHLQVGRLLFQVLSSGGRERTEDLDSFLKFHRLLEVLQQGNVGGRQLGWQRNPFAERELHRVLENLELCILMLQEGDEDFKYSPARSGDVGELIDLLFQSLPMFGPVLDPPGALKHKLLIAFSPG
jgi:hypothetical protein